MVALLDDHITDLDSVIYDAENGFAQSVTHSVVGAVVGFFSEDAYTINAGGYLEESSVSPLLRVRKTDADLMALNSTITRSGVVYEIVEKRPQKHGETLLILRKP